MLVKYELVIKLKDIEAAEEMIVAVVVVVLVLIY